jgi:hypothetical protein
MSGQPDEVTSELVRHGSDALRAGLMAASEVAMMTAARRADRHRAAAAGSDQQRADTERRLRAEHAAARPVMQLAWNAKWWREAGADEISDVWKVTAGWAGNGDPYATVTLARMREQLNDRRGIQMPAQEPAADIPGALSPAAGGGPGAAPDRNAADEVRARAQGEDAAALGDEEAAVREPAAGPAEADAGAAEDLRAAAAADRVSDAGREGPAAAATAALGMPLTPGERLAASRTARPRSRASRAPQRARTAEAEPSR